MDDLGLLRDGDRDGPPPRRPWGLPVAALVTTLLMVGVLVWAASWVTGGGGLTPAVASPEATTPTSTGTTEVATPTPDLTTETPFPTGEPAPPPTPPTPARTVRPTLPPPPPPDPQLVSVPDVTGQRLLRAVLTLRAAGFAALVPGEVPGEVPGGVVPGPLPDGRRVSAQTPPGGTLAPRGSVVVLEVDSG